MRNLPDPKLLANLRMDIVVVVAEAEAVVLWQRFVWRALSAFVAASDEHEQLATMSIAWIWLGRKDAAAARRMDWMTLVFLKKADHDDDTVAVDICRDLVLFFHVAPCSALLPQRGNQQRQSRGSDDDIVLFMCNHQDEM